MSSSSPAAGAPSQILTQPGGHLAHASALPIVLDSLASDTGAVVFIADGKGSILWHNRTLECRCEGASPAAEPDVIVDIQQADKYSSACNARPDTDANGARPVSAHATLESIFPRPVADERLEWVRKCIETNTPATVRGMLWGEMRQMTFRPLPGPDGGAPTTVLCVCVSTVHEDENRAEASDARYEDRGELAQLTERELEVLTLISKGLTTQQVADHLSRSVKTVEWHRLSLGNKLGVSNRVELAQIAIRAGLVHI